MAILQDIFNFIPSKVEFHLFNPFLCHVHMIHVSMPVNSGFCLDCSLVVYQNFYRRFSVQD